MPHSVLTDELIPHVYEFLGVAQVGNSRLNPDGADAITIRLLNRAYVKWAQTTRCFQATPVTLDYSALTTVANNAVFSVAANWDEIRQVLVTPVVGGVLSKYPNSLEHVTLSLMQRELRDWRDYDASAPLYWCNFDSGHIALSPRPATNQGTWSSATAYVPRDIVTYGTPTPIAYYCVLANTDVVPLADTTGSWTVVLPTLTLRGTILPHWMDTELPELGDSTEGFADEPAFARRFWDALAYDAAIHAALYLFTDDATLQARFPAMQRDYDNLVDRYRNEYNS